MNKQELHRRSAIPLFLQMVSALRRRIESGVWPPGTKIPSLEELAEEFGVARATARQAVSALESDGLIWRKQGKGTFVNENIQDKRWLNVITNWDDIARYEKRDTKIRELESKADLKLPYRTPDRGKAAESYRYMKKLHSYQDRPYCVTSVYLESNAYNKRSKAYEKKNVLYAIYSDPKLNINFVHQVFTIGTADIDNARLLEVAIDAPILNLRRYVLDEDDTILYFADNVYPAEIVKIEMDLKKPV